MNDTALPASTSNTLPDPYSHGYMCGSSSFALVDQDYPPYIHQAAARPEHSSPTTRLAKTLRMPRLPAASSPPPMAFVTWIQALVDGRVSNADYQHQWLDSLQPEDPSKPHQRYGYGIAQLRFGPNALYFHGGEMPGFVHGLRSRQSVDTGRVDQPDRIARGKPTANSIMLKVLDQVYVESPLRQAQTSTPP